MNTCLWKIDSGPRPPSDPGMTVIQRYSMLEVRGLSAFYGESQALHGVAFDIAEGHIRTLLGANGAGKTTVLRAVCGMVRTNGEIRFDGKAIAGWATEDIVRLGIAHVPEGRGTFLRVTVEENLQLGAITRHDRAGIAADIERVYIHFPRLRERRNQQAGTLSGGEQQMLAVGRALMLRPRLMLLDAPSFALTPLTYRERFERLREGTRETGVAMLVVEQSRLGARTRRARLYPRNRTYRHGCP